MPHPSIFNDVLGPVMRGPSSSHCAAANRIGLLGYELMGGVVQDVVISFDVNGSLATKQAVAAASVALQNSFRMICDPVANRVEVPCLGKNVMGAANAFCCASMALADYDPIVPLDEVITTMDIVGKRIPHEFRCTALGGLSTTPTSKRIEAELARCKDGCSCH